MIYRPKAINLLEYGPTRSILMLPYGPTNRLEETGLGKLQIRSTKSEK